MGEHGEYNHGVFLYDASLRIVFLLAGPGVPAGLRVKQQARTVDFLPTVLDLMGGAAPQGLPGSSLTPTFSGKEALTQYSYMETLYPKINMGWAELRGIRTNQWKYIRAPHPELYDLVQDPGEKANIARSHVRGSAATGSAPESHGREARGGEGSDHDGGSAHDGAIEVGRLPGWRFR